MNNFINLHGHSEYSPLDGLCKINDLVKRVAEIEQPAIAITDHGNINGVYRFYTACKKNNIKPIIGAELYICNELTDKRLNHITLLCENQLGWSNLVKLNKLATEQFYYKPRITLDNLLMNSEGLICLSGCLAGMCARSILNDDLTSAKHYLKRFHDGFGDRFFIEIMSHKMAEQDKVNTVLRKWSKELNIKAVATNDYHYITKEDAKYQDILLCDQTKKDIDDPTRLKFDCDEFYVKTREEMFALENELDTTLEIADMCDINFERKRYYIPSKKTDFQEMINLIQEGIKKRGIKQDIYDGLYVPRLREELRVIKDAGLVGYFLIVADYVSYAKSNGVLVGPGRGSAGGCLVSFFLGITDIDPIKYNLLFSRFYNEGRKGSLPDIDIDFPEKHIDSILKYVENKYGKDYVAHIGTFMTLKLKGAIKLVCRVIKPKGEPIDFATANEYAEIAEDGNEVEKRVAFDPVFREVYESAKKFVDLTTHHSIHAAGIIISDTPINEVSPVIYDKNSDVYVTGWDMRDIEEVGLVKFDFLSLVTLDVIQDTLTNAKIKLEDIPLNDQKAFDLIATTNCVGIFQLSSGGIVELANKMVPRNIEDIGAIVALYRPGPLESKLDQSYIKRRFGQEEIAYLHPKLQTILKDTYGLMIYQEQVTKICMELAGFSETEADSLRKGIGKKLPELVKKAEKQFISGCVNNKIKKDVAQEIWNQILGFAGYAFNLSHSIGYATITYYTAYLKSRFTVEFMAATLNNSYSKSKKLEWYLKHCQDLGIEVCSPSIKHGKSDFSVKDGKIIFGMKAISGIGQGKADIIEKGKYKDFSDFVFSNRPSKDTLEALIEAGAFDDMGYERNSLLHTVDKAIEALKQKSKSNPKSRMLFSTTPQISIAQVKELSEKELAEREFGRLNVFLKYSPIKGQDLITPFDMEGPFLIEGYIQSLQIKVTKKTKSLMAVGILVTGAGTYDIVFFPKTYKNNQSLIKEGNIITLRGKLDGDKIIPNIIYEHKEGIFQDGPLIL